MMRRLLAIVCGAAVVLALAVVTGSTARAADAPGGGGFVSLPPSRILDTRGGVGAPAKPVLSGGTLTLQVTGVGGVPASGVSTVAINLAATDAAGPGYITAYTGGNAPHTSNVNYGKGQNVADLTLVPLSTAGTITLRNTGYTTDLIADVAGYYLSGASTVAGGFVPLPTPQRVLNTQGGIGGPASPIAPGTTRTLRVAGVSGVPASGVSTVAVTLITFDAAGPGYITAYTGGNAPHTSNVNYGKGQSIASLAFVPVSTTGTITLRNTGYTTDLIADVAGYYLGGPAANPGGYSPVAPNRLLNTQSGTSGPVAPGQTLTLNVAGSAGVPGSGVSAVAVTLIAFNAASAGYITAFAGGAGLPATSNVFYSGRTIANLALVPVSAAGTISLYDDSASTDLIADIDGYYLGSPADTTAPGPVTGLTANGTTRTTTTLTWTDPTDPDLAAVEIRRAAGATAPGSIDAGTLVATVDAGTSTYTDTGLAPANQYSYALFARDSVPNWAAPADVSTTTSPLSWGTAQSLPPGAAGPHGLSCATNTFCMMITFYGQAIPIENGTPGAGTKLDLPAGATLEAISCPATTFCLAIDNDGDAFRFDGTSWTKSIITSGQNIDGNLSCAGASFCVALYSGHAFVWNGRQWSPTTVPNTTNYLSCTSVNFCMSVGAGASTNSHATYLASRWNGSTWSTPVSLGNMGISALSCSGTRCVAVGLNTLAFAFNGSTWKKTPASPLAGVLALSCASATRCTAVGDTLTTGSALEASTFNGISWSASQRVPGLSAFKTTGIDQLLSCVSMTCVDIDGYGNGYRSTGQSWSSLGTLLEPNFGLQYLSCASRTLCVGLDSLGHVTRFDGATWQTPGLLDPSIASPVLGRFKALSCRTTTFCLTIDAYTGSTWIYDGQHWTNRGPSGLTDYNEISCGSPTLCLAGAVSGMRLWNGKTWSSVNLGADGYFSYISCVAAFCAGINLHRLYTYYGGTWGSVAVSGLNPEVTLDGFSCGAPWSCLAVQGSQSLLSYSGGRFTAVSLSVPGRYQTSVVSCTSATACYVAVPTDVYSQGIETTGIKVVEWNGTSLASDGPTALPTHYYYYALALSCLDGGFCAASDNDLVNTTT